ncbi:MAG: DNA topoisomerase VI subunit B [Candidatus Eisenbacteria bacterium]|nr:DNA topoisomerase VI subunit B [Candidatus Eisenbacteria bacterium]MCC7143413.1 DNA topoisomerase VI subunit B [Candidatus Eisenbacteria bacterium]
MAEDAKRARSGKGKNPVDTLQIEVDFFTPASADGAPNVGDGSISAARRAGVSPRAEKGGRDADGAGSVGERAPRAVTAAAQNGRSRGRTATEMAARQREISVSEFFSKNRHLLGFDNPSKALLTTIKEAVDNSLDACEEAGILPDVKVEVHPISEDRYRVVVQDNGPGIVRQQIPKIFGQLLYGSKFHTLKQSRGQQGIGISAAGMYGLLTTGKPVAITSRTGKGKPAHYFELAIDTRKNESDILVDRVVEWDVEHGTRVEITLQATYKRGRHSVDGYLRQIAIANPHARIEWLPPVSDGEEGPEVFERVADALPPEPLEIKPHPHGVELGVLVKLLKDTKARQLTAFLQGEFSRVSPKVAVELADEARIGHNARPAALSPQQTEALHKALGTVKIMAPPSNCISPIGEDLLLKALQQEVRADFYATVTRPPAVYRGNPFQVEVGLAYGGDLPGDELITLYRYANRVPLLYQQSACAITKSVLSIDWKSYHLQQSKGALPSGPMVLLVHIASVWVPFTSESKEAVAHYPEIVKEIRLGLQEAGRRLGTHISRRRREADESKKRSYIQKYIPHIGIALQEMLKFSDKEREKTITVLTETLERSRSGLELPEDEEEIIESV